MNASVQDDVPEASVARAPGSPVERRPDDDDFTAIGFARRAKKPRG
jgi:hypothetical protein